MEKKYKVLYPISKDARTYIAGETVLLDSKSAESLLKTGHIAVLETPKSTKPRAQKK